VWKELCSGSFRSSEPKTPEGDQEGVDHGADAKASQVPQGDAARRDRKATKGNYVAYGDYGLQASTAHWLKGTM
jgi:hypothetical protein